MAVKPSICAQPIGREPPKPEGAAAAVSLRAEALYKRDSGYSESYKQKYNQKSTARGAPSAASLFYQKVIGHFLLSSCLMFGFSSLFWLCLLQGQQLSALGQFPSSLHHLASLEEQLLDGRWNWKPLEHGQSPSEKFPWASQ